MHRVYMTRTRASRGGKPPTTRAVHSSCTRIQQVHNHLAARIHIERRELGRFSLVYNQFRVTSRGGVNVVGCSAGCGRLSVEDPRRIHGARVQPSFLEPQNILWPLYIAGTMPPARYNARTRYNRGAYGGIFSVIRTVYSAQALSDETLSWPRLPGCIRPVQTPGVTLASKLTWPNKITRSFQWKDKGRFSEGIPWFSIFCFLRAIS